MLEQTFGARLEVLEHLGMPVVVDDYHRAAPRAVVMTADLLIPDTLTGPLQYAFFQKGLVVATLSGALLGFIGVYITLRGMSYIGHGLSHAIFGGFAAASLVSASFIYLGAGIWGVSSALAINWVTRKHRIGADAAIGVITTASFALGVALLTKFGSSGPSLRQRPVRVDLRHQHRPDRDARRRHASRPARLRLPPLPLAALHHLRPRGRGRHRRQRGPHRGDADAGAVAGDPGDADGDRRHAGGRDAGDPGGRRTHAHRLVRPDARCSRPLIGAACGLVGMYLSYFADVPSGTMIVLTGAAVFCVALAWQGWRSLLRTAGMDDHVDDAASATVRRPPGAA